VATAVAQLQAARARVQRYRDGLIPETEAVVARMQELQNYMIVGQFELLLAKQEEYEVYAGYLDSLRDYWLARVDLGRSLGGALPGDAEVGPARSGAITLPEAGAGAHEGHGAHTGMDHGPAAKAPTADGDEASHQGHSPSSPPPEPAPESPAHPRDGAPHRHH
jgi:outer membrane protein, heavy metal efflux system